MGSLNGARVVVTSPTRSSVELTDLLKQHGAVIVSLPVFEVVGPTSWAALDSALDHLEDFTWLLFTSRNAVAGFVERAGDRDLPDELMIGAVGTSTARDAKAAGIEVDLVPTAFTGAALAAELGEPAGAVLIARVEDGPPETPAALRDRGWAVEEVPVYRNLPFEPDPAEAARVRAGDFDVVTLMSPSAAHGFARVMGEAELPDGAVVACIGPMTARGAEGAGLRVDLVARAYTAAGLVDALAGARPSE